MEEQHSGSIEYSPPYISVLRLQEALKLLSTRTFSQITADEFMARDFSKSDAIQTVLALKFLRLINDNGSRTDKMTKLQLIGEARSAGLREIVKEAYDKLFTTMPEAYKLSREELYNEFIAVYGISARLARSAVPAFIWLCKESGFEVPIASEPRLRTTQSKPRNSNRQKMSGTTERTVFHPKSLHLAGFEIPFKNGIIKLVIPDTDKARGMLWSDEFRDIAEKLTKLADNMSENNGVKDQDAD